MMALVSYYTQSHSGLAGTMLRSLREQEPDLDCFSRVGAQHTASGSYLEKGFGKTCQEKIESVLEFAELNRDKLVVYSDADVIFLKPFSASIEKALRNCDITFQDNGGCQANLGFFAFRPTDGVLDMLKRLSTLCVKYHDDQDCFNLLFRDVEHGLLDRSKFFHIGMTGGRFSGVPEECEVFHACYCVGVSEKAELIKQVAKSRESNTLKPL